MVENRFPRREDLGLTSAEFGVLRRLDSPRRIQDFVYGLNQNFEVGGETCLTVREVLRTRRAHCIEGAMLAACAFWVNGEPPLLLDMRAVHDFDHVVALYRRHGLWGAISKTNGIFLRSRDPVYRDLRELAMSYFHEYANRRNDKTLREYSVPYDLRRMDPRVRYCDRAPARAHRKGEAAEGEARRRGEEAQQDPPLEVGVEAGYFFSSSTLPIFSTAAERRFASRSQYFANSGASR